MSRRFSVALTAILALGLVFQGLASADDGTTARKKAYIADARHFGTVNPGGLLDASDGPGTDALDVGGAAGPFSGPRSLDQDLRNVQVNDPSLDHVQTFTGTRPFEFSIQSETSIARWGKNVVVGYNSSADQPVVRIGTGLFFTHRHFSGYSASQDGGKTWTSGFVPPNTGSNFTFGDPSVAVDRAGNFYYASLGASATPSGSPFTLIVNKSTDGGSTFAPAVVAANDDGSDKEWLAAGRDPVNSKQDNLYLAWTSFQAASSELRFTKSTDGGATWSTQKILFAPVDDGFMSSFIQFANPVVDPENGRLYIPFLHFSNFDADMIRVLVSSDAGANFAFLEFNVPGAPDKFAFPNVTPGTLTDCGRPGGGVRNVLRAGPNLGGGRFGLPRYRQSTRLITQPSAAVADGNLFIAINSSTSTAFGDPDSRSSIRLLATGNDGTSWRVSTIVPATASDPQHVHPAISIGDDGQTVNVAYYVQQSDAKLRVDIAQSNGSSSNFRTRHLSSASFDLIPSNNPINLGDGQAFRTTNYDRTVQPCYAIGEYLGIIQDEDSVLAAWGDLRNAWTSPAGSPVAGVHSQPDVFFQKLAE